MQEFPDEVIVGADHVYVDTLFAVKESGDICHPIAKQQISEEEIEQFASLLDMSTFSKGNTYMFKSVGMALFDLTVSTAIYEWAQKEDIDHLKQLLAEARDRLEEGESSWDAFIRVDNRIHLALAGFQSYQHRK